MADVGLTFGGDLALTAAGDIATVDSYDLANQSIILSLLTNPGDLIWHPGYGAGLARFVGQPDSEEVISSAVRGVLRDNPEIALTPPPAVTARSQGGGTVSLSILYALAGVSPTIQVPLSFSV